jgi:hypothetical protein
MERVKHFKRNGGFKGKLANLRANLRVLIFDFVSNLSYSNIIIE